MKPDKKLGVITSVQGNIAEVGMYSLTNDADIIWYGEILSGPKVGAYLTIKQNDIKIIATVVNEQVIDQKNTIKSVEFDNRFSKDSINKVVSLQTKGVILSNKFEVTSKYVPMIGNEVTLTTKEDLDIIYGLEANEATISIGNTLLENQPIDLSINKFFASHIGIFGNTGSGKSNTLHKIYLELFRSHFYKSIIKKSQFIVIDFNGEYEASEQKEIFGVEPHDRKIFKINTRSTNDGDKIPIKKEYLFDADVLSLLFDARVATQVPFLRKAMNDFRKHKKNEKFSFGTYVVGTVKKILTGGGAANRDSLSDWIKVAEEYIEQSELLNPLKEVEYNNTHNFYKPAGSENGNYINTASGELREKPQEKLLIKEIACKLTEKFEQNSKYPLTQLLMYLEFQKVHKTSWGNINREHLNPLFNRIKASFSSLKEVIEVVEEIEDKYSMMNIISLVKANQEIKRLVPMLLSKMFYDEHRITVSEEIDKTKHLIIDEAHNILNSNAVSIGDSWQDYRLSIFEEIIKEGRKFGFYLTLSSQRPSDISATILSQVHNYFVHRLVNEKDLRMLENTMPTLDRYNYLKIPSLGKGETIITGSAMEVPVIVKVEKEKTRPNSDDIQLTNLWNINNI